MVSSDTIKYYEDGEGGKTKAFAQVFKGSQASPPPPPQPPRSKREDRCALFRSALHLELVPLVVKQNPCLMSSLRTVTCHQFYEDQVIYFLSKLKQISLW